MNMSIYIYITDHFCNRSKLDSHPGNTPNVPPEIRGQLQLFAWLRLLSPQTPSLKLFSVRAGFSQHPSSRTPLGDSGC